MEFDFGQKISGPLKPPGILNIDLDEKSKIVEIEWTNNDAYHYLNVTKKEWTKLTRYTNRGKGLTTYVNQEFKKPHNYYRLVVLAEPLFE